MKIWQIIIFLLLLAADLYAVHNGNPSRVFTKPLLLICLILFFVINLKGKIKDNLLMLTGMGFALLGDIFLLGGSNTHFMLGLSSFLIMQIIYSMVFFREKAIGVHQRRWQVFPVFIVTMLFLGYILPHAGILSIAVIVYALSIMMMLIFAILRWKVSGYWWIVAGACAFMFSDSLLSINKFDGPVSNAGIGVMLSYGLAQLMICHGYLIGRKV